MSDSPYSKFEDKELILRDELAIDRTLLANERTLLAYLRSAVALIIAGVSIMHFADQGWFWMVGLICVPGGIFVGIVGSYRAHMMHRSISIVRKQAGHVSKSP